MSSFFFLFKKNKKIKGLMFLLLLVYCSCCELRRSLAMSVMLERVSGNHCRFVRVCYTFISRHGKVMYLPKEDCQRSWHVSFCAGIRCYIMVQKFKWQGVLASWFETAIIKFCYPFSRFFYFPLEVWRPIKLVWWIQQVIQISCPQWASGRRDKDSFQ